jgi:tRNA-intron endonuclease, archaea type
MPAKKAKGKKAAQKKSVKHKLESKVDRKLDQKMESHAPDKSRLDALLGTPEPELLGPLQDIADKAAQKHSEQAAEKSKKKVMAIFSHNGVVTENSDEARDLYSQSRFGTMLEGGKVQLSLIEAHYLKEKGKITITDAKGKAIIEDAFIAKAKKLEHNFFVKYCVYKDIRNRGYIIKTALKFGADFRVYDRGVKPGEDHARWVVFPIHEGQTLTWHDFAAKNRVAHSTKKRLMIGIVDAEMDVTYYEIRWVRP